LPITAEAHLSLFERSNVGRAALTCSERSVAYVSGGHLIALR